MSALAHIAAKGGLITLTSQILRFVIQLIGTGLVARIVAPNEFGLVVLVTAIVGFGDILRDFGLCAAAMTAKNLTQAQRSNLFWTNTAIGAALTALVIALAKPLAHLYHQPAVTAVAMVVATTFFFNGIQTQYQAELARKHHYTSLAGAEVAAAAISWATAFALAWAGHSYWSLVWQLVIFAATRAIGRIALCRWVPSLPNRHTPMDGLYTFGFHLAATQLLVYASSNIDRIILGMVSSTTSVGLYNQAYKYVMAPNTQLMPPLTSVALSVLSKLHGPDFARYIARIQLLLGYGLVSIFAASIGCAEAIITILLGHNWLHAVPYFQILAIAGAFQALTYVTHWVFLATRRADSNLRYALVVRPAIITAVLTGALTYGALGVAISFTALTVLAWPFSLWWIHRIAPINTTLMICQGLRVTTIAICASTASWWAATVATSTWGSLTAALTATAATYALALATPWCRNDRTEIRHTISLFRSKYEAATQ